MTDCAVLNELLANISAMDATLTMLTGKGAAFKQQLKTPAATAKKPDTSFWCFSNHSELLDRHVDFPNGLG